MRCQNRRGSGQSDCADCQHTAHTKTLVRRQLDRLWHVVMDPPRRRRSFDGWSSQSTAGAPFPRPPISCCKSWKGAPHRSCERFAAACLPTPAPRSRQPAVFAAREHRARFIIGVWSLPAGTFSVENNLSHDLHDVTDRLLRGRRLSCAAWFGDRALLRIVLGLFSVHRSRSGSFPVSKDGCCPVFCLCLSD